MASSLNEDNEEGKTDPSLDYAFAKDHWNEHQAGSYIIKQINKFFGREMF
jgi:hypothetical protein